MFFVVQHLLWESFRGDNGTGEFLDEADLKDKYKSKPDRLQGIMVNGRRFACPVSNTVLIEDMQYKATTVVATRSVKRAGSSLATETTIKRHRPPSKDDGGIKIARAASAADVMKALTEPQASKLDKVMVQTTEFTGIHTKGVHIKKQLSGATAS